jgi:eukaryotic-like serine/threonine-protein kinase
VATWGHGLWRPAPEGRSRIGRYQVRAQIGRGGTGSVLVAEYEGTAGFRKRVAIKVLRPDVGSAELDDSMRREASAVVALEHPGIVGVLDLLDGDGLDHPAIVMEYVHGETLAALVDAVGALPPSVVASIGIAIADALAYAHRDHPERPGIVHRDVSPQNVLISYDGVARLADFGIAQVGSPSSASPGGTISGRPAYMPPEQRRGETVDGRADVYALGVVLYELATGTHPWRAAGRRVERPPPPGGDVPEPLWRVIRRAAEPAADDRFAGAGEMAAALRGCADELGAPRGPEQLAALMDVTFAERRHEKDLILAGDLDPGRDTEVPGATPATTDERTTPTGHGERPATPARAGRRVRVGGALGVVAVASVVAAVAAARRHAPASATPSSSPCVLVDPTLSPADHDATWAAARVVGIALDRTAGAEPVHGYRAQDRYGWTTDGMRRAEDACRRRRAGTFVQVSAGRGGQVRATVLGADLTSDRGTVAASATAVSGRVADRLGLERPATPPVPALDDRGLIAYLGAREDVVLERPTREGRDAVATLVRDYPALEDGYVEGLIGQWWAGTLDQPGAPAPAAAPSLSPTGAKLGRAILALARRDPERAEAVMSGLAAGSAVDGDPLALYVAGEAFVHAGRPADGALYLERAIALDPQLSPAMYHLFLRRLARGDRTGVEDLARLRDRIDPSGIHGDEYRAWAALATGDLDGAVARFEALLRGDAAARARLNGPDAGIVYALLLGGHRAEAERYAREVAVQVRPPAISAVMVEPIMYADALGRSDHDGVAEWESRLRTRLGRDWDTANHWQAAYVMAILDTLAGRPGARARWIGAGPPVGLPRSYRYAPFARVLDALDGVAAADAAGVDADPWAAQLAAGLARERAGDAAGAVDALDAAMASSSDGEFDCIIASELAAIDRRLGRPDQAADACDRVLRPRVPRAYCYVLRARCR